MACVSKIGSLYELVTKNVVVTTTNTIFGINPRIWLSLPCEGLLLLKIRQVVPTTGETLPVQIAVPANSTVSTVGDDTCCPVTGVAVVNPINVAVTGAAMVNNTERLVYFNKVRGVLRLMDCCVPTTAASASEPLTRCLTPTGPREDGRWRTLSRCSINAGPRNLITPLGEISNICSLCSIATTFLRYWIATRK